MYGGWRCIQLHTPPIAILLHTPSRLILGIQLAAHDVWRYVPVGQPRQPPIGRLAVFAAVQHAAIVRTNLHPPIQRAFNGSPDLQLSIVGSFASSIRSRIRSVGTYHFIGTEHHGLIRGAECQSVEVGRSRPARRSSEPLGFIDLADGFIFGVGIGTPLGG